MGSSFKYLGKKKVKLLNNFKLLILSFLLFIPWCFACSSANASDLNYPENFNSQTDSAKIDFIVSQLHPDTVAVIICDAVLKGHGIDKPIEFTLQDLNGAVLYAYTAYPDSCKVLFGEKLNSYAESLPTDQRMTLTYLAMENDPYRLGYKLGKEYYELLNNSGEATKSVSKQDIKEELAFLREMTKGKKDYFRKLKKGLETAIVSNGGNWTEWEKEFL